MKVVGLEVENFKILKTVSIRLDGKSIIIGGDNGQGKSSVLDAIWVGLKGRRVAPPKPIRKGEEVCRIKLDLGEYVVFRKFTITESGDYTDTLKLTTAEGLIVPSAQRAIDELMGQIGFDPLAFVMMGPDAQGETLLEMVPLPIDIEQLAQEDATDFQNRRDINREVLSLRGQIEGIPKVDDLPTEAPDRQALLDQMGNAATVNAGIEREKGERERIRGHIDNLRGRIAPDHHRRAEELRAEAQKLLASAAEFEAEAKAAEGEADAAEKKFVALPALAEPIDTDEIRQKVREADEVAAKIQSQARRTALVESMNAKQAESDVLTAAMEAREKTRREALAGAKMPIEGLGFAINEKGKPVVTFNGFPFEQASTADQIRASTAIAMAANPELRVLRIKDGSLLDENSMGIINGMAEADDYQLIIEVVGAGGVGIEIRNGEVVGAEAAAEVPEEGAGGGQKKARPAAKKPAAGGEGEKGPLL